MIKRLKKLRKLWTLTKEQKPSDKVIDLSLNQGRGEFLSEFDEEEYHEHIKLDELGWRPFYDKIKNILK